MNLLAALTALVPAGVVTVTSTVPVPEGIAAMISVPPLLTEELGDVVLPKTWRLLGGVEAISGALLCGLSTAFIFVILTALLKIRREKRAKTKEKLI